MTDIRDRLRSAHARDLTAAIQGGYDSDPIFTDALAEIRRLEQLAQRPALKIALAEVLGFFLLPVFCMAHAWEPSPVPSIKPWPTGTTNLGPHRTLISRWRWSWLNRWYANTEDGVSGLEAWVWTEQNLMRYQDLLPAWTPTWCIAFAWSVWRNGANNLKRPLRADSWS